jgi:hypothetical protein
MAAKFKLVFLTNVDEFNWILAQEWV